MVEEARLESVYTSIAYRRFESCSLRKMKSLAGQKQQGFSVIMNIVKFSKVCSAIVNHKKTLIDNKNYCS